MKTLHDKLFDWKLYHLSQHFQYLKLASEVRKGLVDTSVMLVIKHFSDTACIYTDHKLFDSMLILQN